MATCSADKTIKLWNYDKGGYVLDKTLYGHSKWVWDCVFSCDTDFLITVSSDAVAKIWKTDTGDSIRTLKGHKYGKFILINLSYKLYCTKRYRIIIK